MTGIAILCPCLLWRLCTHWWLCSEMLQILSENILKTRINEGQSLSGIFLYSDTWGNNHQTLVFCYADNVTKWAHLTHWLHVVDCFMLILGAKTLAWNLPNKSVCFDNVTEILVSESYRWTITFRFLWPTHIVSWHHHFPHPSSSFFKQ